MFLAALANLGVDFAPLEEAFQQAGVPLKFNLWLEKKNSLQGQRVEVQALDQDQPERNIYELLKIVQRLQLAPQVLKKIEKAFWHLAKAEAKIHGQRPEKVHFHEIGAVDSLADIVGAFWGLEALSSSFQQLGKIREISCSPLPWFSGTIETAHGSLPLPAPATLELLKGKPVYPTGFTNELITPTGALLIDQLADCFASGPQGKIVALGVGLGSYELHEAPNCLRIIVLEDQKKPGSHKGQGEPVWTEEEIYVLESNLDHLTGEEVGNLFDVLFAAGALDVVYLQGIMKKNRPGGQLQVLCREKELQTIQRLLFKETLTLGIRCFKTKRIVLDRKKRQISLPDKIGELTFKGAVFENQVFYRPEFEALQKLSHKTGRSIVQLRYLLGLESFGDEEENANSD